MSASDIQTISGLVVGPVGALALAMMVILTLAKVVWSLLQMVLAGKDQAIAYRDEQITALRGQIVRQQDLHDKSLDMLQAQTGRRR